MSYSKQVFKEVFECFMEFLTAVPQVQEVELYLIHLLWMSDPRCLTLTYKTLYNTLNTLTQPETHSYYLA